MALGVVIDCDACAITATVTTPISAAINKLAAREIVSRRTIQLFSLLWRRPCTSLERRRRLSPDKFYLHALRSGVCIVDDKSVGRVDPQIDLIEQVDVNDMRAGHCAMSRGSRRGGRIESDPLQKGCGDAEQRYESHAARAGRVVKAHYQYGRT